MPTPRTGFSVRAALQTILVSLALFPIFITAASPQNQDITASLTGAVRTAGAAVPNATVTATNKATGQTRTTTTSSEGQFAIPGLPPGQYTVKVAVQGFKEAFREVSVQPGAASSLDFDLDIVPVGGTLFGGIKGKVEDDKGHPIEEASVEFVPDDGSDSASETSAKDGSYSRSGLRAGTYDVIVKASGYVQAKKRVKVEAHQQKTQDFKLKPATTP
jgi:uncharacterized membrane protein